MVLIEISSICDLNCKTCPRKKRKGKQGHMSLEMFKDTTDKIIDSEFQNSLFLSGFGESLLNPHFFDMIKYAKSKGCKLIIPTNCNNINENNIKWLRLIDLLQLSIDSLKDEKRRTINPQKILDLIPSLQKYHINFMLNVALGKENFDEVDDFLLLNIEKQIPINFISIKPIFSDDDFLFKEMEFLAKHTNELKEKIKPFPEVFFDESCRSFEYGRMRKNDFAISWNGGIYPCSFAFFRDYQFGNIKDFNNFNGITSISGIKEIWDGKHPLCNFCKENDEIVNNPQPISNIKKISSLRDIHIGERCFVLGTGRSINREIFKSLRNEFTIGVNGIVYAKKMFKFEPTYFCFSDQGVITVPEYNEALNNISSIKAYSKFIEYQILRVKKRMFSIEEYKLLNKCYGVKWASAKAGDYFNIKNANEISLDLVKNGTAMCGTAVQDMAIPLAAWLGFKDIYLIGCDCNTRGHFYEPKDVDSNLSYRVKNQYRYFAEILSRVGKQLINLSPFPIDRIKSMELKDVICET